MTAPEFLELYWPLLLAALAIIVLVAILLRPRRSRVELSERDSGTRTLMREAGEPVVTVAPALTDSELTGLKGVGPRLAAALTEAGVPDIAALARLDEAEAEALDARLRQFSGRVRRDRLAEQARLLVDGDASAYEAAFGKRGSPR